MASDNQFTSRLLKLQEFERSQDYSIIINTLDITFDSDANNIIKKWISNNTLSNDEKKYIDSYSNIQLSYVKYCLFNANTTDDVQNLIDKLQGRLFQRSQIATLTDAVEFIREHQFNSKIRPNEDDLILVYIMRMIDARSLTYRLIKVIALPPTNLNDALYDCLFHRHAKKYLHDVKSNSEKNENMSIDYHHQFFIGCCTFAVALYDENKNSFKNDEKNNKYVCLFAKYIRIMLNRKDFVENKSIHYCIRGILALLTNCIPHEYWLNIINQGLANENDEDAQKINPFNLDLFSSIINKLLGSNILQKRTEESGLNDETLLLDTTLVFLVKWSDTQRDIDDDDEEEEEQVRSNTNSSSPLNQPNQLLRCFQSDEIFRQTIQILVPYIDAKYDRVRLMALSILSTIMNNQDFQDLKKQKPHMAKDLVKLIFDFIKQAAKQPTQRYKGISFDTLLHYLYRFLVQDFIKTETLPYISQLVYYANNFYSYTLKILRRVATNPDLKDALLKDKDLTPFLNKDADIKYGSNTKIYKIITDIRQSLAPPPKITEPLVSTNDNICQAFISYCHNDKVTCEIVQEKLKEAQLFTNIWVDNNYMRDNLVETVARAMSESKIVFVLLSDGYCESSFCRREWSYAMGENIKVYVIVVQKDFEKKKYDWVRFNIGGDLYYKISRNDEFQKLINVVGEFLNKRVEQKPKQPSPPSPPPPSGDREYLQKTSISTWTSEDIQHWCLDKHLNKWRSSLTHFDGRSLLKLRRDLSNDRRIPLIGKENALDLFDIVLFKSEIDKLLSVKTKTKESPSLSSLAAVNNKPPTKKLITKRRISKSSNK